MSHSSHSVRVLRHTRNPLIVLSAGALLFFKPMCALGAPTNGIVVRGDAGIAQSGRLTTIDQRSIRAVIDWRGFGININELVKFSQPGANAVVLNRVTGGDPTSILGQLSANGRVFISNPNGILFGAGSKIDVAGLVATTLSIDNDDFMNVKDLFTQDLTKANSWVVNQGDIHIADNGFCFLVASGVSNQGTIVAQFGKVVMASGKALTLDFNGDGLMTFTVSGKVLDSVIGQDGKPVTSGAENSGTITAKGGEVVMVGNASGNIFSSVVNNSGIIEATAISEKGGTIILSGGDEGITQNSGTLDVSGKGAGQAGGTVKVLGEKVGLFDSSRIDASGDTGGGTVLVGGDCQGRNPDVQNASRTYVASDATINADGIGNGGGGKVIVWSNDGTRIYGTISARGGELGGNGGFAEVSGKAYLDYQGFTDLRASKGRAGTLLLDPTDITLVAGDADPTAGTLVGGVFNGGANDSSTISIGAGADDSANTLLKQLSASNVTITTTSAGALGNGDITVNGAMSYNYAHKLAFKAERDITVGFAIANSGSGDLEFNAGRDISLRAGISTAGNVSLMAATGGIDQAGGTVAGASVTLSSATDIGATLAPLKVVTPTLSAAITGANKDIYITPDNALANVTVSTDNGDVTISGGGKSMTYKEVGSTLATSGLKDVTFTNSGGSVKLGATTVPGNLNLTAAGAISQAGALSVHGTTTLAAGAGNSITLNSAGNNFSTVSIMSGKNVSMVDIDSIDLGASTISGTLTVTASGAITDSGALLVTGTTKLAAGAGNNITLDSAGNNFSTVSITSGKNVSLVDSNAIALGASTVNGTLNVTASGAITDSGTLAVTGTTTLAAGAGNSITLNSAGNNFSTVSIMSGKNVSLVDSNAIDLGASTVSGTLSVTAGGAITDSGALAVTGTTKLAAGAGNDITLDESDNDFSTVSITNGKNVSLVDGNAIELGASTVSGTLNITANGAITDSGALHVTGTTTLAAGAGNNITLNIAGNDFSTFLITSGKDVTLVDSNAINLGASTVSSSLNFNADGTITVTGDLNTAPGSGSTILTTKSGDIALGANVGNSTGNVTITSAGNVMQTGSVTVAGNVVTMSAESGIGASGSSLNTAASTLISTSGTGGIYIAESDGVSLGTTSTTTSGDIVITSGGAMTTSGNVSTAGNGSINLCTTGAADGMTLTNPVMANGSGAVTLTAAGMLAVNNSIRSTTGSVILSGGTGVTHTAAGDLNTGGSGTIDLIATTGNIMMANGTVYTAGTGAVTLTAANNIALGRIAGNGPVSITATAGSITDVTTGDGSGSENIVGTTVTLTAGTGIGGSTAASDIDTAATTLVMSTATGGIHVAETDAVDLGTTKTTASGDVVITAGGAMTISGGIRTKGNGRISLSTRSGSMTLLNSVTADGSGSVTLSSAGDIMRTEGTITGTDVTLIAGGGIGSNASPVVTASTGTLQLESSGVGSAGEIAVTEGNALATGRLSLTTASTAQMLTINDSATGDAITVDESIGNTTDSITLNATEGKINAGAGMVSGNIVSLTGLTGVGDSGSSVKTTAATLMSNAATGGIYIAETDEVALGATSTTTSGDVVITAGGAMTTSGEIISAGNGSIDLSTTSSSMTLSNTVNAGGSGNVTLTAAGLLTVNNAVGSTSGNLRLTGGTGVMHNAAGSLTTGGTGSIGVTATTGDITMASGTVYTAGTGEITLQAASNVTLGLAATGGNVSVTATDGSIADNGTGSESIVGQAISLVAGGMGTIGSETQVLDINGEVLNAQTSGGSIYVADLSGGFRAGLVTTGGTTDGDVTLSAIDGSITAYGTDRVADIEGKALNLSVTGAGSTIGLASNPVRIDANVLNAGTQGGGIWLTDIAGGVNVGLVDAGGKSGGTVVLTATVGGIFESGSDAADDIVGNEVAIDIAGAIQYDLGTRDNLVEIGAQTLRLGNSSNGYAYPDLNGTAHNLSCERFPGGLIPDEAHLPKLIFCGTQIIGGAMISNLNNVNRGLSASGLFGSDTFFGSVDFNNQY